jgi:hypothetical protein
MKEARYKRASLTLEGQAILAAKFNNSFDVMSY